MCIRDSICENLAHVRFQGGRDGDGGEIGTAAAQRLDHSFYRNPLEAGADQDGAFQQDVYKRQEVTFFPSPYGIGIGNAGVNIAEAVFIFQGAGFAAEKVFVRRDFDGVVIPVGGSKFWLGKKNPSPP